MSRSRTDRELANLQRLAEVKRINRASGQPLGPEMVSFFKQAEKRKNKFGKIGECWAKLIPETLNDHCALESFHRGTLTVLVDSSAHLYELKQLLLAGLQQQLLLACKAAGLRKIALKPGRWYGDGEEGGRKLDFT
jgi:hypothetical protein